MKPSLAITVGEITGVGPELALGCAADPALLGQCRPILYGPEEPILAIADQLGLPHPPEIRNVGDCRTQDLVAGRFDAITGRASFEAVEAAIADAIADQVQGLVTGPIQKEAWHQAGIQFPGHTELLADRTGTDDYAMMLAGPELAVILATIHVPLADVPAMLSVERVGRTIAMAVDVAVARSPGHRRPCIAVCGLNPHAGENGMFGHGEEEDRIVPAILRARRDGAAVAANVEIVGPLPPDTAFTPAMRSKVDVYVCQYHDQGLIPLKALSFDDGVNVTLGLPIVRTSVDHGTAMDLAWQGVASPSSFRSAIEMAVTLGRHRKGDVSSQDHAEGPECQASQDQAKGHH